MCWRFHKLWESERRINPIITGAVFRVANFCEELRLSPHSSFHISIICYKSELILAPLDYLFSYLQLETMFLTISGLELIMLVLDCRGDCASTSNPVIFLVFSSLENLSKGSNQTSRTTKGEVFDTVPSLLAAVTVARSVRNEQERTEPQNKYLETFWLHW